MASAPRPTGDAQAAVAAFGGARWKRRPFAEYQAAIDACSARQEAPLAMAAALPPPGAWRRRPLAPAGSCLDLLGRLRRRQSSPLVFGTGRPRWGCPIATDHRIRPCRLAGCRRHQALSGAWAERQS
eukprot:scaffold8013_cov124-Isochrysis_galbana.AAC.12